MHKEGKLENLVKDIGDRHNMRHTKGGQDGEAETMTKR